MEGPFIKAKPIIVTLMEAGFEAYFVGGSVRDYLLGRSRGDIDIATSALPEDVQSLFDRTIPVGIKHGTVVVLHNQEMYEVTTFRIDGDYQDFRRPSKVEFVTSLEEDLSRRDFTINAIAMDIHGTIIDPFEGQKDLKNKFIQTVGNPDDRFLEDPLRIMRAIRFVSQLDFELSPETKKSIESHANLLTKISVERVLVEFEKLLTGKANEKAIILITELQIQNYLPQLNNKEEELARFAVLCSKQPLTLEEQWTLLIYSLKVEDIEFFFKQWKSSNEKIKTCRLYLNVITELKNCSSLSCYTVYTYGPETVKSGIRLFSLLENKQSNLMLTALQTITRSLPILTRKDMAITGNDLIEWYSKQGGPWLSETIEIVEKAIVDGEVENNKEKIKEWLLTCNPPFENNY
ncbi:MAG TPA: CCA tRNA nucleotidyltransferase [Bacillales bacterium]|nr:CCA tRNA nucleotidyltransferase [Bacillales bacterium]